MPFILDYCQIRGVRQKIYKQSLLPLLTGKTGTSAFEPQAVVSSAMRYGEEKQAGRRYVSKVGRYTETLRKYPL